MEEVVVSTKGQIVIPKYLRDALGIKTGDTLLISKSGNSIVITTKADDPLKGLEKAGEELAMKNIRRQIKPE